MHGCLRLLAGALILLSSCSSDLVFLSPPTAESDESSALLAVHENDTKLSLYASDLSSPIQFETPTGSEVRLEWLYFRKPLESLGLSSGWVPAPDSTESGLPIRGWSRTFEAPAGADATWRTTPSISSALEARRLPGDGCSGLDHARSELVSLGAHAQGRVLAVIDANRLLVTTSGPVGAYIVHRDGRVEATSLGSELDVLSLHRSATERDGVVWVTSGDGGRVFRIDFGDQVRVERAPMLEDKALTLEVELDANAIPRVYVGSETTLYRLDSDRWIVVQYFSGSGRDDLLLATLGPDHLVVGAETSSVTVHFEGESRFEFLYPGQVDRPKVLALSPALGLLMGTQESTLWRFQRASREWTLLGEFGRSDVIRIARHAGAVVAGFQATPELAEYHAERGLCPLRTTTLLDTRQLVSWGDELVVLPRRTLAASGLQLLRIPNR